MSNGPPATALPAGFRLPRALYVHVPFCPVVCPYCDFHKMRRHEGLVAAYLARIEAEAATLAATHAGPLDTVYFGGGTPSHLSDAELSRVVAAIDRGWGWPARIETTLEADPLTFDAARARSFAAMGFGRVSIGVQSADDAVLAFLGRAHTGRQGLAAVDHALSAGLRVSADVITAVPGQDARADLEAVAATGVRHVSVYSLTVEPGTPFAFRGIAVDDDQDADDFDLATEVLAAHDLERYEVSNHAAQGEESRHNSVYWRGDYFLALGPGAASFLPRGSGPLLGVRRTAPPIKGWLAGEIGEEVAIDPVRYVEDCFMTGLRTREGVDLDVLAFRVGRPVVTGYGTVMADLERRGLVRRVGPRVMATADGLRRLNPLVAELMAASPALGRRDELNARSPVGAPA